MATWGPRPCEPIESPLRVAVEVTVGKGLQAVGDDPRALRERQTKERVCAEELTPAVVRAPPYPSRRARRGRRSWRSAAPPVMGRNRAIRRGLRRHADLQLNPRAYRRRMSWYPFLAPCAEYGRQARAAGCGRPSWHPSCRFGQRLPSRRIRERAARVVVWQPTRRRDQFGKRRSLIPGTAGSAPAPSCSGGTPCWIPGRDEADGLVARGREGDAVRLLPVSLGDEPVAKEASGKPLAADWLYRRGKL